MSSNPDAKITACPFQSGDPVYMVKGSYEGTPGIFLNLRSDPKWADIREADDSVRAHPVEWMARAKGRRTSLLS